MKKFFSFIVLFVFLAGMVPVSEASNYRRRSVRPRYSNAGPAHPQPQVRYQKINPWKTAGFGVGMIGIGYGVRWLQDRSKISKLEKENEKLRSQVRSRDEESDRDDQFDRNDPNVQEDAGYFIPNLRWMLPRGEFPLGNNSGFLGTVYDGDPENGGEPIGNIKYRDVKFVPPPQKGVYVLVYVAAVDDPEVSFEEFSAQTCPNRINTGWRFLAPDPTGQCQCECN